MKNTKKFSLLLIVSLAFMVMSSCHGNGKEQKQEQEKQTTEKQEASNIEGIDIAKMVKDYDNYNLWDSESDTVSWPADCIRLEEYWKQPCLYLAPNVEHYLDSIAEIVCIPCYNQEGSKEIVYHAVHELRRFQTGERKYYPEQEVKDAINTMFTGFSQAVGHADEGFYYFGGHYFYCFVSQAAQLCPNVEFICNTHSEDHRVGLLICTPNIAGPMWTVLIYKSNNRCISQLVGFDVLGKIFQLKDNLGRDYYLLTTEYSLQEYLYDPALYLYAKHNNEVLSLAVRSEIPYVEMANGEELYYSAECRFNPTKLQWDLCNEGEDYWYKIEGTKSFYLHLDGEKPYFEVH